MWFRSVSKTVKILSSLLSKEREKGILIMSYLLKYIPTRSTFSLLVLQEVGNWKMVSFSLFSKTKHENFPLVYQQQLSLSETSK